MSHAKDTDFSNTGEPPVLDFSKPVELNRDIPSGKRLYNPYQDLNIRTYKPFRQLYELPTSPELVFGDESPNRRHWGDHITCHAGIGWVSGALTGGTVGLFRGLKGREPGESKKVAINRLLNLSGHTGRKYGNNVGVLGIMYGGFDIGIAYLRDNDNDNWNTVLAGFATGALYKIAHGPRSALLAGTIGGVLAGSALVGKSLLKRADLL